MGARLLPELPEPPSRLRHGVLERRQLAQGRRALQPDEIGRQFQEGVPGVLSARFLLTSG